MRASHIVNKLQATWMTALILATALMGLGQPSQVNAQTATMTASTAQPSGERLVRVVYPSPYGR